MDKKVLNYITDIMDRPLKLGETDCNSITANILDLLHGTNIKTLTDNIKLSTIKQHRASNILEDVGYHVVSERPKTGDFIIIPEKFFDSCMFVYSPGWVVSSFNRKLVSRKVRTMRLEKLDINSRIYRYAQ